MDMAEDKQRISTRILKVESHNHNRRLDQKFPLAPATMIKPKCSQIEKQKQARKKERNYQETH